MFIAKLIDGEYEIQRIDSELLGLPVHISELAESVGSLEERARACADRIRRLFDNPGQDSGFTNSCLLNAGVRIYAAGRTDTILNAIELARVTLASGRANSVLEAWQGRSKESANSRPSLTAAG